MTDSAPLSAHITTRMPSLQPIEQRVAQAILEDMDFVLHATADQLAAKVGTSRTSVIRTAKALGYDGYQQLRVALTQEIAQRHGLRQGSREAIAHEENPLGLCYCLHCRG